MCPLWFLRDKWAILTMIMVQCMTIIMISFQWFRVVFWVLEQFWICVEEPKIKIKLHTPDDRCIARGGKKNARWRQVVMWSWRRQAELKIERIQRKEFAAAAHQSGLGPTMVSSFAFSPVFIISFTFAMERQRRNCGSTILSPVGMTTGCFKDRRQCVLSLMR